MRLFDSITNSINMNLSKLCEIVKQTPGDLVCYTLWGRRVRYNLETEQQQHRGQGVASYREIEIEDIRK